MDYGECVKFLERFIREPFENLYYSYSPFSTGIRFVGNDMEYVDFLDTTYDELEILISIFMVILGMV